MRPLSSVTIFELSGELKLELLLFYFLYFIMSLLFLREDGSGNITNQDGTEALDFEIEGDPYNLNKLSDFEEYLKNRPLDIELS